MGYKATVKDGKLHLRAEMNMDSKILVSIPNKTTIDVKRAHNRTWVKAAYNNKLGYVMREFLTEKPQEPAFGVEGFERYGEAPLKKGSEGRGVAALQRDLRDIKWHSLEVDGKFGPITETTVKEYQGMTHIVQDGIAGIITKSHLYVDSMAHGDHGHMPPPYPHP
jgi:hypothetical protein